MRIQRLIRLNLSLAFPFLLGSSGNSASFSVLICIFACVLAFVFIGQIFSCMSINEKQSLSPTFMRAGHLGHHVDAQGQQQDHLIGVRNTTPQQPSALQGALPLLMALQWFNKTNDSSSLQAGSLATSLRSGLCYSSNPSSALAFKDGSSRSTNGNTH